MVKTIAEGIATYGAGVPRLMSGRFNPPPPPPGDFGDGRSFKDRPFQSSQIFLNGANGVVIENLYWENRPYVSGQQNSHVCIYLNNCSNITIRNCDFDSISEAIAIFGGTNITVEWCRANDILGPSQPRVGWQTGNFIQTVTPSSGVIVQDCKLVVGVNGDTEDILSFYNASNSIMRRLEIDGTYWSSTNGTGAILGDNAGDNNLIENVRMLNPGQVGIAIAGGTNNTIKDCQVYRDASDPSPPGPGGPANGNVGMYAFDFSSTPGWGGHQFINNRVRYWSDIASTWNGLYNPDGFPASGNYNDATLDPADFAVVL